jgi:ubiquinone/menaquinone biosynthesis C-methylase UbiE
MVEAARVTKRGGMLFINNFLNKYHPLNLERRFLRKCFEIVFHQLWLSPMGTISRGELKMLYKKLNFDVKEFDVQVKKAYIPLEGLLPVSFPDSVIKWLDENFGIDVAYSVLAIKR